MRETVGADFAAFACGLSCCIVAAPFHFMASSLSLDERDANSRATSLRSRLTFALVVSFSSAIFLPVRRFWIFCALMNASSKVPRSAAFTIKESSGGLSRSRNSSNLSCTVCSDIPIVAALTSLLRGSTDSLTDSYVCCLHAANIYLAKLHCRLLWCTVACCLCSAL